MEPDKTNGPVDDPMCYTIKQFCRAHRISTSTYYRLDPKPDVTKIGRHRVITVEAAARWRATAESAPVRTQNSEAHAEPPPR